MKMTPEQAIEHAKQMVAHNGGTIPANVFLMVFGHKGDRANNAVAQWFSEQGAAVSGVRFDMAAYLTWLDWQVTQKVEFANEHETQSAWRDYVWDMPGNPTCGDGLKIKQVWKARRWQDYDEKEQAAKKN